jgi:prephenate dehydratase
MLRYDLTIVAEHEFRVKHCLLAKPGVTRDDLKYAISHPQALAQCDNFLRGLGITPVPTYDTAGSAKMIAEGNLPGKCTPQNTCAIASDLAGKTYGLNCLDKGIEDDDTNFTRFLLLGRKGVVEFLNKQIPSKTSVVFTLHNTPGALYKALACFSLRDIDFSKIESRPTSASLLNFLKFRSQQQGRKSRNKANLPRFRYCFYLDFLANEFDENTQNAVCVDTDLGKMPLISCAHRFLSLFRSCHICESRPTLFVFLGRIPASHALLDRSRMPWIS